MNGVAECPGPLDLGAHVLLDAGCDLVPSDPVGELGFVERADALQVRQHRSGVGDDELAGQIVPLDRSEMPGQIVPASSSWNLRDVERTGGAGSPVSPATTASKASRRARW